MTQLDKIKAPVADEIALYEQYLRETMQSDNESVQHLLDYIIDKRGKSVRPLMALLCASIHNGGRPLPRESLLAAMLLEMIHTATLVHDDVIDEAFIRRGSASVNALWRAQRAVLVGDFILARSFSVGMQSGAYGILAYITEYLPALCEGEMMQSERSDSLEMTRAVYNDIIYRKTATLLGTSCGVGAMSAGATPEVVARMKEMGDSVGMAFQIKDDILDYRPSSDTGKPLCGDLRERKITLPLLMVIEKSTPADRRKILSLLSGVRSHPGNAEKLYEMVHSREGIIDASREMDAYIENATRLLETCPPSQYRDSLASLFSYVATREM